MKLTCMTRLLPAFLMLLFAITQTAASAETSDDLFEMGEVVVTGKTNEAEGATSTTVITAADIREAGHRTLDEALKLVPGLYIRTGGQGVPRIDVRGLRTRQLSLLLNGIPVNSTFDNQFNPSLIPTEHIAKIKVTKGPSSVLYGEGGNAAIINIITKKAAEGNHGGIDLRVREKDAYQGQGFVSHGGDKFSVFAGGSFEDRDSFPLSDSFDNTDLQPTDERVNSDSERQNLFTNLMYTPSDQTRVGLNVEAKKSQYGIPPDSVSDIFTNKKPDKLNKLKYERAEDVEGLGGQLFLEHSFDNPLKIKSWVFVNELDETNKRYDDILYNTQTGKNSYTEDTTTTRSGLGFQAHYNMEKNGRISIAASADQGNWDSTYQEQPENNGDISETDETIDRYNLSVEYSVNPVQPLGIVMGVGNHWQDPSEGSAEEDYSYMAGVHYDLFENTRLKASHAKKVRFPSLRRLFDEKSGNLDLEAENTYHYQAGVNQKLPSLTSEVEMTLFRIDAKDFLEKDELTDIYENMEEYRFQGVELTVRNSSIPNLDLMASYTYLDAENRDPSIPFDVLEHRPEDKVTVEGTYSMPFGIKFHGSYLYINKHYEHAKDLSVAKRLDNYHVVDIKVSKTFRRTGLTAYVGADNLFDEDYVESYGLPKEGQCFYAGVSYNF